MIQDAKRINVVYIYLASNPSKENQTSMYVCIQTDHSYADLDNVVQQQNVEIKHL